MLWRDERQLHVISRRCRTLSDGSVSLSVTGLDSWGFAWGAIGTLVTVVLARVATVPVEDPGIRLVVVTGLLMVGMAFAGWVSNRDADDWILQAGISLLVNWVLAYVIGLVIGAGIESGLTTAGREIGMGLFRQRRSSFPDTLSALQSPDVAPPAKHDDYRGRVGVRYRRVQVRRGT